MERTDMTGLRARLATARVGIALLGIVVLLSACTGAPEATPSQTPVVTDQPSPTQTAAPDPPEPRLESEGTASDNLAYFDFVNTPFLADGNPGGRPIIDNLVAAGFDKGAMEVTRDRTAIGGRVDSLQFAVRMGDDCLIGQAGAGGYTSTVGPALASGDCLIGRTRPIDW